MFLVINLDAHFMYNHFSAQKKRACTFLGFIVLDQEFIHNILLIENIHG